MEQLRTIWEDHHYYVLGALAAPVAFVLYKKMRGCCKQKVYNSPPNTVVLYQGPRGPFCPSISPFIVKLEMFLRMANIPYVNDFTGQFSSKGKTPFIVYNGEAVPDSQFCIEFLNKKLDIDLDKTLTKEDRAVAKAVQIMVDEHLVWPFAYFRWVYDKKMKIVTIANPGLNWFIKRLISRMVNKTLYGQGIGRHSTEEIKHIMLVDLQALADYLGNKQFMMGNVPCVVDCSVFGLLTQFIWHAQDDVVENLVQEQFPSLYNYALRMKERFWPDWDECITHGGTKPATK